MRYERVLLLTLMSISKSRDNVAFSPPIGTGYVAEALRQANISYDILHMNLGYTFKDIKKKIDIFCPQLIGFSMMTPMYKKNYELIQEVKRYIPKSDIVVGGAHPTTMMQEVLSDCQEIDFLVIREGEETLVELCQGIPLNNIKGLMYREGDKIIYNGDRPFIQDLDSIHFPTYHKFELNKYSQKVIPLFTTRGCPYRCIFCTVSTHSGKKVRARSPKNVVDEIEYWVKRGYTQFLVEDDNFTFYQERVMNICDEIEARGLTGLEFKSNNGFRPDKVNKEILKRMKDVGFNYIRIAVEGGNNKVLKSLKKDETIEDIEKAIEDAISVGIEVDLGFVVGAPNETWADVEDSFQIISKYPRYWIDMFNLIPFPKTELFEWVKKNNYFIKPPEEYLNAEFSYSEPVFVTPELSYEERVRAINRKDKLKKIIIREAAERKLIKYGLLGKIIAFCFATNLFQKLHRRVRFIRIIVDKIRRKIS